MGVIPADVAVVSVRRKGASRFEVVAGLQTRSVRMDAHPLVLDGMRATRGGVGWRHLRAGGTPREVFVEGRGILTNGASDVVLRETFFASGEATCRIVVPHFGTFAGGFVLTSLAYVGASDEPLSWRMALRSSGEVYFVPPDA